MVKEKNIFLKLLFGEWNTKTVVVIAIGSALFGVLLDFAGIPVYTNTKLSVAYLIPIYVGALFGPIPAGLVGLFGNFFADLIGGAGFWPDWWIGNFVATFVIGLLPLYGANIKEGLFTKTHAIIFSIVSVLGLLISFAFIAPILNTLFYGGEQAINFAQGYIAVVSDGIVTIVVGVPLLFYLAKRFQKHSNLTVD
ncbi:ECF-type riboflavin transporter substrate-binding protein [Periweissella beninensis]|uniref:ECF-type riboflavin transporter substrate-binding protein n=1 Tax=Periweissella beninensis TaxID=504936 RepID=A0ABT0VJW8_9LACO|nr:ECF-type riboflavin transporter substrate-binding protein [Periweissella beninensis]MBM7544682.1 energy-coupling factor transport system substrate-specific component [Periweissella beninensis]MCM2437956.1 ECF-type riboflavin transporter substrate-binding protein [Periweissella beninensis]MCT4395718.1 ECF-type riboflavin transporter substrate-binding protein [Periweissella beninensis]